MNKSTLNGKFNEAKGKVKQAVGEATHNDRMANEGAVDQVKGIAQQTWGKVVDGAKDIAETARTHANEHIDAARASLNEHKNDVMNPSSEQQKERRDAAVNKSKEIHQGVAENVDKAVERVHQTH